MSIQEAKLEEKYQLFAEKLKKCLTSPKSEKEFVQLLLKHFYTEKISSFA